jgi:CubicO group peptidase (beta-lactamase class C family)
MAKNRLKRRFSGILQNIMRFIRFFAPPTLFLGIILLSQSLSLAQQPAAYSYVPPEDLKDGIRTGTLKDAGFDETKIVAGTDEILSGNYANIHSLLIFKGGRLVYENYFTGEDFERGKGPLGVVKHTRDTLHDIRSVTKTVVGLAVLHAHSKGKIKTLDQPVFDLFPEYAKHAEGDKKNITVRHLLTMTAGLEWDEQISYADPKNSEIQMNRSNNPIEYVLTKKVAVKPGSEFNYSGGCTQLLAEIVKKVSGLPVDEYTAKYIFAPLGITTFNWVKLQNGRPAAASGLRLRSRDMAKLGLMVMNGGKWKGKHVIPSDLARNAVKPYTRAPFEVPGGHVDYGYQIWLPTQTVGINKLSWAEFEGNGGQIVIMDKVLGIIVAVTAGNYNRRDMAKNSADIYLDIVLPALTKGQ